MVKIFKSEYWKQSKNLSQSLVFITPWWLLYEFFAYGLNNGWSGNLRTGIEYLIIRCLQALKLPLGLVFFIPSFFLIIYFLRKSNRECISKTNVVFYGYMFLESIIYAAFFGLIIGYSLKLVLSLDYARLNIEKAAALVINLGSGLYEEFFFRWLIISGLVHLLRRFNKIIVYTNAVILSAGLFAHFHYLDLFTENFELNSFLFRFVAGIAFSVIFLFRGLGVTACTHSFYNIFLMLK